MTDICNFVPPHEPWTCITHEGGYRTRLDVLECDKKRTLAAHEWEMLIATPDDPPEKQIQDIAYWLAGDSGVPQDQIAGELTAWYTEIVYRVKNDLL